MYCREIRNQGVPAYLTNISTQTGQNRSTETHPPDYFPSVHAVSYKKRQTYCPEIRLKLAITAWAPATLNALTKPYTPSPSIISPAAD